MLEFLTIGGERERYSITPERGQTYQELAFYKNFNKNYLLIEFDIFIVNTY
jgi:hypothetical protein